MAFRIVRTATARFAGTAARGDGQIELGSGAFSGPYSLKSRVEEGVPHTNPEELIGAGNAACFAMSLTSLISDEGHEDVWVQATAHVKMEETPPRYSITQIKLEATGGGKGLTRERFEQLAEQAKTTCPISRALAGTEITLVTHWPGGDE